MKTLLLPPSCLLLLFLAGWALRRRKPKLGRSLQATAGVGLWLACTPVFAGVLLRTLQPPPRLPGASTDGAGAVVVLSAGVSFEAQEFGGPTLGPLTLERLRYGIRLHRETGLPLLMTGGTLIPNTPPIAALMAEAAQSEFGAQVGWVETRAADTWDNARFSAELLREDGIENVLLVTHAWHTPRARRAFERNGLQVTVAPTGYRGPAYQSWRSLLPSWKALRDTSWACHEWLGRAYYELAKHP